MSSIFGYITVETPPFQLVQKAATYEVRLYEKQIRAETTCELPNGLDSQMGTPFRILAGFIFGGNTKRGSDSNEKVAMTAPVMMNAPSEKVAMTAPVMMNNPASASAQKGPKPMKMAFVMPTKYTVDTLPVPKDAKVQIVEVPEHKMAVITFSGNFSNKACKAKEAELRAAAAKDNVKLSENPEDVVLAGYNPPWCLPFLKKNEVMIPVIDAT